MQTEDANRGEDAMGSITLGNLNVIAERSVVAFCRAAEDEAAEAKSFGSPDVPATPSQRGVARYGLQGFGPILTKRNGQVDRHQWLGGDSLEARP